MKKYMIGIDIGTQSVRVQMYNECAECIAKYSTPQYLDTARTLYATEKASFWWKAVQDGIKEVVKRSAVDPAEIVSIGCDAVMHSPVAIRKDGTLLDDDVQLYCDKRAAHIAETINAKDAEKRIYQLAGNIATSNWQGVKIRWIKENQPEVYENAYKFLSAKDYINYMLTGEACVDYSEGTGSYCMDRVTLRWSDELLRAVGIEKEKLPQPKKAYETIGKVCKSVAQELGISSDTAVVCGGGDMMAALYVSGLTTEGNASDCTGTGSTLSYYCTEPILNPKVMNLRHVLDGWVAFGCLDSSGGALRWLRDNLAKAETSRARAKRIDEYDYLSELAAKTASGADGLLFFPYLMGERTMGSSSSRGTFMGLNYGTEMGCLVRSVMEGIAFEHKRTLDIFESSGKTIDGIYHSGGAARCALWNQIKADIYQKPVYTLVFDEGSVLGSALLGGIAAGLYPNPEYAAKLVTKIKNVYEPNQENVGRYAELYQVFCETHDVLQGPFSALAKAAAT